MADQSCDPATKHTLKKVEDSDRILNLFNIAGMFIMAHAGIIGIIKAVGDLNSDSYNPYSTHQVIMESSTLLICVAVIFLNAVANKIGKFKKHNELIIKVKECYEKKEIKEEQKEQILSASKKADNLGFILSILSILFAIIFLVLSSLALLQYFHGNSEKAALFNIVAYILYIFSVILIFINKFIGDVLQTRMEKRYLNF